MPHSRFVSTSTGSARAWWITLGTAWKVNALVRILSPVHAGDVERDVHRRATGIGADGVLHAHVLGEGLLEARREQSSLVGGW